MMWGYGNGWPFGMGFGLHWIIVIAFVAVLVWGGVSLFRSAKGGRTATAGAYAESALEILKARFARGELTREEFRAMRKELEA